MKIVVLDGYTLNPGDLSWQSLQQLGETVIYDRSAKDETADRIADANIVLTNKVLLTDEIIDKAVNLRYIGVMATGYNVVDTVAAAKRNIRVTNVPAYSTASVAQLTFAIILELFTHVSSYAQSVSNGDWVRSKDFSYQKHTMIELQDKTLGIIGLGRIGQAAAAIALAFNMRVIASHKHPERDKMNGVRFVDEEACFSEADIVTLHCPLNEQNKYFVNQRLLRMMKPSAFLINTSRGDLINEKDLAQALNTEQIAGAGLDVLSAEPPAANNPLLHAKNCLVTPHIGWATYEARSRLMYEVVQNVQAFIKGVPVNVVS
ncbi:D-2-hydroxyacid dehydrogenase [Ginsengibacter hankyongi]|uniref:D-2-hydroxyacid dehydrogenase n=1 Tax=Ginsengibacter hankyongi TaxID=2607284 RepID=A0A5J5IDS3_9BACT|nr:D-2-hydroxyacid dehydrogenase [Ginsengibacter hankyongi]KAA9036527.1 D-2-hydroxyacid dehydrogenase [Ginsengibacter hankyongi]